MSKRSKQQFFVVEDGHVHSAIHGVSDLSTDMIRIPGMDSDDKNIEEKQFQADGYM